MNIKVFKTLVMWYTMIVGSKTCDLWLTFGWFNQHMQYVINCRIWNQQLDFEHVLIILKI